jgi:hypothetical protein
LAFFCAYFTASARVGSCQKPARLGVTSKTEKFMRTTELFRSCANEHVAAAAMACIGGALERRVAVAARRAGLPVGAYVTRLVADYDRMASPRRRKSLERGMDLHDMPILAGLRHVVHTALEGAWDMAGPKTDLPGDRLAQGEVNWAARGAALAQHDSMLKPVHP